VKTKYVSSGCFVSYFFPTTLLPKSPSFHKLYFDHLHGLFDPIYVFGTSFVVNGGPHEPSLNYQPTYIFPHRPFSFQVHRLEFCISQT
jgi:hypothetical protein